MLRRTRGFLLLPVALTLVAVGALAFAMTRDAGMSVNRVEAEYDTEVARYLAEAAVNLARWKNNQQNCNDAATFAPTPLYRYNLASNNVGTGASDLVGTMTLNGVTVVSNNANNDKSSITVDVSGATTTTPAASLRIVRTVSRYNLNNLRTAVITGAGGANTTIANTGSMTPQGTMAYMELTDNGAGDQSYGLLRFSLTAIPKNALVKDATLRLNRIGGESIFVFGKRLDVHRVTTAWDPQTAVWNLPWMKPGGDYAADPVDGSWIVDNRPYFWRLDALVAGWMNGTLANNGVLLKPTKLNKSRFNAFASGDTDGPQLTVNYFERCN